MSQQKVDRYKEQKANRKEIIKKEKKKSLITKTVVTVIAAVFVIWVGYSGFRTIQSNIPRKTSEVDISAISDYMEGLSEDDADASDDNNTDAADDSSDDTDSGESDNTADSNE